MCELLSEIRWRVMRNSCLKKCFTFLIIDSATPSVMICIGIESCDERITRSVKNKIIIYSNLYYFKGEGAIIITKIMLILMNKNKYIPDI